MKNKTRDIICSLLFLILGIFMFSQALKITSIMGKDLGSGFMPKVIAVALVLTSLLKLIFLTISVVFSIATYVLFVYLIQKPLPTGILSFL